MTVKWIAEIGSNHNQNLLRIIRLIRKAKHVGCDAVKFQLFKAERLYAPEFKTRIEEMKSWELPGEFVPEIEDCCGELDIEFGCSVFDLDAVDMAGEYADWLKIGSYELLWRNLIKAVIESGKPWMLSTGMARWSQVEKVISMGTAMKLRDYNYRHHQFPIVIFHCNSNYPARPRNCDLGNIRRLKRVLNVPIGWSDHTVEPGVIHKAVAFGAEAIEFHFDLEDGEGFESQTGHCWKPSEIKEVVYDVKVGEVAGLVSDPHEDEARKWRTDPSDGLRPLKKFREELSK